MNAIPCIPESAPFTAGQRLWLNGYLAGLFSHAAASAGAAPDGAAAMILPPPRVPLAILYGTQTGSAASLAKKLAAAAKKRGFDPVVADMAKHETVDLASQPNLLIITSTYGDGEMPDNAAGFWQFLNQPAAPALGSVRYSVLGLGDSSYAKFCQAARDFDARLAGLGASRLHPRVDCDVDYDQPFAAWMENVLASLAPAASGTAADNGVSTFEIIAGVDGGAVLELPEAAPPAGTKQNPFPARLVANHLLSQPGSAKEVRHLALDLKGSGIGYEAGDALGVMPVNCPVLVEEILQVLGATGDEPVSGGRSLHETLLRQCDLARPAAALLARTPLESRHGAELPAWLQGRDVLDVLRECSPLPAPEEFPALLRKLQPRLYSISSSPAAHAGEVHLTVGIVRYQTHGRSRKGVCSTFLADRAEAAEVPVFIHRSPGFRLPADGSRPVIMVGPGTGIAPFRGFLHERAASGATGPNWLFFGDQQAATDFYYQEELESLRQSGVLTRLDTAFSRDQETKIYVQHRMLEHAAELHAWLEKGAHFYVCGDASRMAKDVDRALHTIYETSGGLSPEAATAAVQNLKSEGRYQRDVY